MLLDQGNNRYQGREAGQAGLVLRGFGGGSRQEAERHSGGCCDSSGSVPDHITLSSQPRSYRKMMCLPASPPALALRTCLGLGLFVLLCLGIGKQEPGWECEKGLGTGSSTHVMVNRGWWPSEHFWCLLPGPSPGQGLGWLALH